MTRLHRSSQEPTTCKFITLQFRPVWTRHRNPTEHGLEGLGSWVHAEEVITLSDEPAHIGAWLRGLMTTPLGTKPAAVFIQSVCIAPNSAHNFISVDAHVRLGRCAFRTDPWLFPEPQSGCQLRTMSRHRARDRPRHVTVVRNEHVALGNTGFGGDFDLTSDTNRCITLIQVSDLTPKPFRA